MYLYIYKHIQFSDIFGPLQIKNMFIRVSPETLQHMKAQDSLLFFFPW